MDGTRGACFVLLLTVRCLLLPAVCGSEWARTLPPLGRGACAVPARILAGQDAQWALPRWPAHMLRLRGGFKSGWGQKYIRGLSSKRKGPSRSQKQDQVEDGFMHLLRHKQWAAKEQEMQQLIASGSLSAVAAKPRRKRANATSDGETAVDAGGSKDKSPVRGQGQGGREADPCEEHMGGDFEQEGVAAGERDVNVGLNDKKRSRQQSAGRRKRARVGGEWQTCGDSDVSVPPDGGLAEQAMEEPCEVGSGRIELDGAPTVAQEEEVIARNGETEAKTEIIAEENADMTGGGADALAAVSSRSECRVGRVEIDVQAVARQAMDGLVPAQVLLGESFLNGAQAVDADMAASCFHQALLALRSPPEALGAAAAAAKEEDEDTALLSRCLYGLGVALAQQGEHTEAVKHWHEAVDCGSIPACLEMGLRYLGAERDTHNVSSILPYIVAHQRATGALVAGEGGQGGRQEENWEMASEVLKRGAEGGEVGPGAEGFGLGHARYCRELCRFQLGALLLRQARAQEAGEEERGAGNGGAWGEAESVPAEEMRASALSLIGAAARAGVAEAQFAWGLLCGGSGPLQKQKQKAGAPRGPQSPAGLAECGGGADAADSRGAAMTWLRRAALQGHMLAANDLALLYLQQGASKRALALRYVCVGVCVRARVNI